MIDEIEFHEPNNKIVRFANIESGHDSVISVYYQSYINKKGNFKEELDIRLCTRSEKGKFSPTNKGVYFPLFRIQELKKAIEDAENFIKDGNKDSVEVQ